MSIQSKVADIRWPLKSSLGYLSGDIARLARSLIELSTAVIELANRVNTLEHRFKDHCNPKAKFFSED